MDKKLLKQVSGLLDDDDRIEAAGIFNVSPHTIKAYLQGKRSRNISLLMWLKQRAHQKAEFLNMPIP